MNRIVFICPTCPPYDSAIRLLESFRFNHLNDQSDLFFVFSSKADSDLFIDYENKIVIQDSYELQSKSKPSVLYGKKLFALNVLKYSYRYLITIDDDSFFYQNVDLLSICKNFYHDKILLGNFCQTSNNVVSRIIKSSYLCVANRNSSLVLDSNLYLWSNQLCIYSNSLIDDFFCTIDYYNRMFNWKFEEFEYYIYMYYLIIYHNFLIVDMCFPVSAAHSCCEHSIPSSYNLLPQILNRIMQCRKTSITAVDNKNLTLIIKN